MLLLIENCPQQKANGGAEENKTKHILLIRTRLDPQHKREPAIYNGQEIGGKYAETKLIRSNE